MLQERYATEKLLGHFRTAVCERLPVQRIEVEHKPSQRDGRRADLRLAITIDGEQQHVLVEFKRHAFAREIEVARRQLADLAGADPRINQVMVWAESLSEGARKSLEFAGIGCFDGSGSFSIQVGRTNRSPTASLKPPLAGRRLFFHARAREGVARLAAAMERVAPRLRSRAGVKCKPRHGP